MSKPEAQYDAKFGEVYRPKGWGDRSLTLMVLAGAGEFGARDYTCVYLVKRPEGDITRWGLYLYQWERVDA